MDRTKVQSDLGLAMRAGKLLHGEESVLEAIKDKRARIVFLASDSGASTTKRINDKCAFYNVSLCREFTTTELSSAIGKENRKVLAVCDRNFAILLEKAINE